MRLFFVAAAVATFAMHCQKGDHHSLADAGSASSANTGGETLGPDLLRAICMHGSCGGDTASVRIYRDEAGKIGRLFRQYGSHLGRVLFPTRTRRDKKQNGEPFRAPRLVLLMP